MSLFPDAYTRALSTNLFTRDGNHNPEIDVEQIVPLVLARAGAEKRAVEGGLAGENALPTLIKIVEDGIAMVRQGKNPCCYGPSLTVMTTHLSLFSFQHRALEILASG